MTLFTYYVKLFLYYLICCVLGTNKLIPDVFTVMIFFSNMIISVFDHFTTKIQWEGEGEGEGDNGHNEMLAPATRRGSCLSNTNIKKLCLGVKTNYMFVKHIHTYRFKVTFQSRLLT